MWLISPRKRHGGWARLVANARAIARKMEGRSGVKCGLGNNVRVCSAPHLATDPWSAKPESFVDKGAY